MRTRYPYYMRYQAPEKGAGDGGGGAGAAGEGGDKAIAGGAAAGAGGDKGAAGDKAAAAGAVGADGKPVVDPAAGDWGADWRTKIAGDDAKALKQLERYASPKDVWNKARSFEARMSSGELKSALPKDATPEATAAWRAENGIPATVADYQLALKGDRKIAPEDKPVIDAFLGALHGTNATSAQASAAIDWYHETQAKMTAERAVADEKIAAKASDELHGEWGNEYRPNMNKINGLLDTMPAAVKDLFKHGRLADQNPILANADVLRALNTWARQINPVSTLIPNASGDVSGAIDSEIKVIESNMKAPKGSKEYKAYWEDNKAQERLRELYDGRERAKAQK